MSAYQRKRTKHIQLKAQQKAARRKKRENVKSVLDKNIEEGNTEHTNLQGYKIENTQITKA